jgi:hypothetical protein
VSSLKQTPMKNSINTAKRKLQVKQGVYDGRYREKVVVDRKKKESREFCRYKTDY